jgi:hypothetical protein
MESQLIIVWVRWLTVEAADSALPGSTDVVSSASSNDSKPVSGAVLAKDGKTLPATGRGTDSKSPTGTISNGLPANSTPVKVKGSQASTGSIPEGAPGVLNGTGLHSASSSPSGQEVLPVSTKVSSPADPLVDTVPGNHIACICSPSVFPAESIGTATAAAPCSSGVSHTGPRFLESPRVLWCGLCFPRCWDATMHKVLVRAVMRGGGVGMWPPDAHHHESLLQILGPLSFNIATLVIRSSCMCPP